MNPRRFFFVMIGALLLTVLVGVGVVFGGNVLFQKQSKKLSDLKVQSRVIEEQEISLVQAKKDIEKYSELDDISRTIVPQDKDQAKTVREISNIANESGISLKAISFAASSLGQAGSAGATKNAPPTSLTQVKPISGIPGVYTLEIVITSPEDKPIPYKKFLEFLERLEGNRRTAHVDKISISPAPGGDRVSFVLTLNAYVKP